MKSVIVAAAVVLAVSSVAATAQETAEAPKEKKICRTDKATGSLTRVNRICLTEAQWREYHSRTKKGVDEMQNSASGGQQVNRDAER